MRSLLLSLAALAVACSPPVSDAARDRVAETRARNDGPAMWRVTDADSTLYLFGTVHLLAADTDWQREDARNAFAEASTVFFELPSDERAEREALALTQAGGFYRGGRFLSETMTAYELKLLEAAALNADIPLAALETMRPWLAGELLTVAAARTEGLLPEFGADEALKSRAARAGKEVVYLDTIAEQIELSAGIDSETQFRALIETLERSGQLGEELAQTADDWAFGRVRTLTRNLVQPMQRRYPAIYQALLVDRNAAWADRLDAFMQGDATGFAAVGISHLLGDDSLRDALRARGYDVERYLAYQGENVITPTEVEIARDRPETDQSEP